jgi:hypothetical protein
MRYHGLLACELLHVAYMARVDFDRIRLGGRQSGQLHAVGADVFDVLGPWIDERYIFAARAIRAPV